MGFKVGDKVVTTGAEVGRDYTYPWPNGTKGVVTATESEGYFVAVKNDEGVIRSGIMASRFELVEEAKVREFKTGDRIRVKDGSQYNGKTEANVVDAPYGDDYFDFSGEEKVWADWWDQPTYIAAGRVEKIEPAIVFDNIDEPAPSEGEDEDDDFPFKVGDTVTATITCMGIKEGENYVIAAIDDYSEYLTVDLPNGEQDAHPVGEFRVKEPEPVATLKVGDRVYVARVPGVSRYGAGWATVESDPDTSYGERQIFSARLDEDNSTWLFSAVEDVIEAPGPDPKTEPVIERVDHTALVEKADALIGALTITQEQQYALSVLRSLRDALVEESYR